VQLVQVQMMVIAASRPLAERTNKHGNKEKTVDMPLLVGSFRGLVHVCLGLDDFDVGIAL
jgi:hypothetical protein